MKIKASGSLKYRDRILPGEIFSNEHIKNNNLRPDELGLLAWMLSKPAGWEFRVSQIEKLFGVGAELRRRIFKKLREIGYLELCTSRGRDGKIRSVYILRCQPSSAPVSPPAPPALIDAQQEERDQQDYLALALRFDDLKNPAGFEKHKRDQWLKRGGLSPTDRAQLDAWRSKARAAGRPARLVALADWASEEGVSMPWLRKIIAGGIGRLAVEPRKGKPKDEELVCFAGLLERTLLVRQIAVTAEEDSMRIKLGIDCCLTQTQEWPTIKFILSQIPARKGQKSIDNLPPVSEEAIAKGRQELRNIMQGLGSKPTQETVQREVVTSIKRQ